MMKIHLQPGEPAPDVSLKTIEGEEISLATTWGNGRHVLLVFLRHSG